MRGKILIVLLLTIVSGYLVYNRSIQKSKWLHVSIDDTILLFADLDAHKDSYHSIFDNSTLNFARELHNLYGAKVSFYCFYEFSNVSLNKITNQYLHEFEENSDWLTFGFHAYDGIKDYNVSDIAQDYAFVMQELE